MIVQRNSDRLPGILMGLLLILVMGLSTGCSVFKDDDKCMECPKWQVKTAMAPAPTEISHDPFLSP